MLELDLDWEFLSTFVVAVVVAVVVVVVVVAKTSIPFWTFHFPDFGMREEDN